MKRYNSKMTYKIHENVFYLTKFIIGNEKCVWICSMKANYLFECDNVKVAKSTSTMNERFKQNRVISVLR